MKNVALVTFKNTTCSSS